MTQQSIPFILQGKNIVLFIGGLPITIDESHLNYKLVLDAIKSQDWAAIPDLITVSKAVTAYANGRVTIIDDEILFDGKPVHNALSSRMLNAFKDGFPIDHFSKFMENLDSNPSYRARNELVGFLDACQLPITDDGCFLAYKKVRENFTDVHTGTFDNSPGAVVKMNRRDVNEDPNQTCSAGLHVCSYSYLSSFPGQRVVSVKVNPRDCVSVPVDYNLAKLRTCEYTVIQELDVALSESSDVLSSGPSVVTGFYSTGSLNKDRFSAALEDVFGEFSDEELFEVVTYFRNLSPLFAYALDDKDIDMNDSYDFFNELLEHYTFTEVRKHLRKIFA